MKEIRVKAEFEPIIIEAWDDKVEAIANLKALLPSLSDEQLLELLGLEELKDEVLKNTENKTEEKEQINNEIKQNNQERNTFHKQAMVYLKKVT